MYIASLGVYSPPIPPWVYLLCVYAPYYTLLGTPLYPTVPLQYTFRVHRRSPVTALAQGVTELLVTERRVTVRNRGSPLPVRRPVSLLVDSFPSRRPGAGGGERCEQLCAERHAHYRHPFHCWVLVIPVKLRPFHGAIPYGSHPSDILPFLPF